METKEECKKELFVCLPDKEELFSVIDRAIAGGYDIHIMVVPPRFARKEDCLRDEPAEAPGRDIPDNGAQTVDSGVTPEGERRAPAPVPVPAPKKRRQASPAKTERKYRSRQDTLKLLEACWKPDMISAELRKAAGVCESVFSRIKGNLPEHILRQLDANAQKRKPKKAVTSGAGGGAIRPVTWSREEKAERKKWDTRERNRVNSYSSDKNLIF